MLRRFLNVFARPEHPLALFLDDLRWLDSATLDMLADLLIQLDVPRLLVIGAYRNKEVNSLHPPMRKLSAIRNAGALMEEIRLEPLRGPDESYSDPIIRQANQSERAKPQGSPLAASAPRLLPWPRSSPLGDSDADLQPDGTCRKRRASSRACLTRPRSPASYSFGHWHCTC